MTASTQTAQAAPSLTYTGARLSDRLLLVGPADDGELWTAIKKVRAFQTNSTAPGLALSEAEFSALRRALAGENSVSIPT